MDMNNIFTKKWWSEVLELNEVSNDEVKDRIVKGFKLVPFYQGFKNSYKTETGDASIQLAKRIHEWVKKNFPDNKIHISYEKTYKIINIYVENQLHESPPINFEEDDYHDYVLQNKHKIEKAATIFNLPISDMEFAFSSGEEVVLSDEIWKELQNSKSYNIKTLDDAIAHSLKIGIDPKPYIENIKKGEDLPLPLVLRYGQHQYYLVGGEVILSLYKALGSIPTVLQGTLNLQTNTLPEPIHEIEEHNKLKDDQIELLELFLKFAINKLNLNEAPKGLTLSYDNNTAKEYHTFGTFNPSEDKIWLYVKNRNLADILRTLAHELVHLKQKEEGRININSGETGSSIENEANAKAGELLRDFGKKHENIYESLIKEGTYGDYLFGDKESGVKIKWYDSEKEKDTIAEKELFNFLKKYTDSEVTTYSNISLDPYLNIFRKIKKEYPSIGDTNLSPNDYIYRGTIISEEEANKLIKNDNKEETKDNIIIPNQEYSSRRKLSSWSTRYYPAASFAMSTSEISGGGVPIVVRAKVQNAELFFNPKFMNKISNQIEDEVINATNPISVDIMLIKEYNDEFE